MSGEMKDTIILEEAYVRRFGKLVDYSYSFQVGMNVIEAENAWGKTTFAAFIKAMLFGMEYSRATKVLTQRRRYMPYEGGMFGGTLTFRVGEKSYRVERFFGKTDKEDTFCLYDVATNLLTTEYTECLGEELWQVDRDSYEKTSFINLEESTFLNDVIAMKLGNIQEQEADMEQSTKALDILDKAMTGIQAKRGSGGLLGEEKRKVKELEIRRKECLSAIKDVERLLKKKQEEELVLNQIVEKEVVCEVQLKAQSLQGKRDHYESLVKKEKEGENAYKQVRAYFKDKVITRDEIDQLDQAISTWKVQEEIAKKYESTVDEETLYHSYKNQYGDSTAILEELDHQMTSLQKLRILEAQGNGDDQQCHEDAYESLEKRYGGISCSVEEVDHCLDVYEDIQNIEQDIERVQEEYKSLEGVEETLPKKGVSVASMSGGILLILVGFLMVVVESLSVLLGVVLIGVGIVLGIMGFLQQKKSHRIHLARLEQVDKFTQYEETLRELNEKKTKLYHIITAYLEKVQSKTVELPKALYEERENVNEWIRCRSRKAAQEDGWKKKQEEIHTLKCGMEEYLAKYDMVQAIDHYEQRFGGIRERITHFHQLKEKRNEHTQAKNTIDVAREKASDLARPYGVFTQVQGGKDLISALRDQVELVERCHKEWREHKDSLEEFIACNSVEQFTEVEGDIPTMEVIQEKKSKLMEDKKQLLQSISSLESSIVQSMELADELDDVESELANCGNTIASLEVGYESLKQAHSCLQDAKEQLATNYKATLQYAFQKYITKLNEEISKQYEIDIQLNVLHLEEGAFRSFHTLSKGIQDLMKLCLRLALVEAVYKEVPKPIIILDDPFVNLDHVHLTQGLELVKEIARDYQVVYFTCHGSRSL